MAFYVDTDSKDSDPLPGAPARSPASGLPDESYYRDEQHAEILSAYPRAHRARCSPLAGVRRTQADAHAPRDAHRRAGDRARRRRTGTSSSDRDADLTYNLRDLRRPGRRGTGLRLGGLGGRARGTGRSARRGRGAPARLPDRVRRAVGQRDARGLEGWAALAARSAPAPPYLHRRARRRELRLLRPHAVRHRGDPRPLEARRLAGRGRAGRGRRQGSTSSGTSRRGQGADGRAGRPTCVEAYRGQHHRPRLDDAGDPRARRWPSSTSSPPKIGYPASGATTRRS